MTSLQFMELFVSVSLQVAALVIVAQWLTVFVSGEGAHCRIWTICYVALLMLVMGELLLPHPRLIPRLNVFDVPGTTRLTEFQIEAGHILLAVWGLGAALSILMFVSRTWRVHRFLQTCIPVNLATFDLLEADELYDTNHSSKALRVLVSPQIATPFCWQFHRPCIVLPAFLIARGGPELRSILRHEIEHLRTGHPLQLFLQRTVEILFWFHPMVWWASQQSARAREFACDAAAVQSRSEIAAYLQSLLAVVEHAAGAKHEQTTTMTFGHSGTLVAERARRLVRQAAGEPNRLTHAIPFSVAALSLVGAALLLSLFWLPIDPLASSRSGWSPWPSWSSSVLHDFGIAAPDFDPYDRRAKLPELRELSSKDTPAHVVTH